MSISVDYPMPAPSLSPHATHWGRGLLLALAAHLLIVIWAYWPSHSQPETPLPPAAVIMLLAPQVQAPSLPLPLPQGVQQQMAASASSAKAEPPAAEMIWIMANCQRCWSWQKWGPLLAPVRRIMLGILWHQRVLS